MYFSWTTRYIFLLEITDVHYKLNNIINVKLISLTNHAGNFHGALQHLETLGVAV